MLKPSAALLESDARFRDLVFHDAATGEVRPMCIDDLRNMIAVVELNEYVPVTIRDQFDIARNVFVYSWFIYEFATLAEQQCFAVLEMALRHRLDPAAPPNTTRSPGLDKLLKAAVNQGWLKRDEFMVPSISGANDAMCLLDFIPRSRNHVMHGNIQLLPQGTPDIMRLCADVMNKLFASVPAGVPT
jgi:hypothetical protein